MKGYGELVKKLISLLGIIFAVYIVGVYLWASYYTPLAADDFSHGVSLGLYREPLLVHVAGSVAFSLKIYETWQGTFFSMFLQALLSPINGYIYPQLRLVMLLEAVLIFVTVYLVVKEIFKFFSEEKSFLIPVLYALIIFAVVGLEVYEEVFFWFSGATSYGFPFAVMMLAVCFLLKYNRSKDDKLAENAKIFGFIACGGTLMIAGATCYIGLVLVAYFSIREMRLEKQNRNIFLWWFAGALLNTIAPGNYIRKGEAPIKQGLITSFIATLKICKQNYSSLVKSTGFMWILLLILVIGCFVGINTSWKKNNILLIVLVMISPAASIIAAFPAVYGYGAQYGLNDRCSFVLNSVFVLTVSVMFFVLGYILSSMLAAHAKIVTGILFIMSVTACCLFPSRLTNNKVFELNHQLAEGQQQNYYKECKDFLVELDKQKGKDVRVSREDLPQAPDNVLNFYYFDDETNPDSWLNNSLRVYFDLKSFAIK